jgi:phage-related minor tail protein
LAADRLQQYQTEALIKANEELQKVQDDIAKLTMTEMEKKYYDIDRAAKQAAESAIRAEEKIRGRKLTTNEAKAYYDAAKQGAEELKTANQDLANQSMTFDTGWKQALNNYLTESTDKAAQAKRVFEGFTKGIEDAFVNFAKTGKLSFKDLLNFMLEEFVRSNVRNLFADIFGGGGSGGSTIGSIFKSIFGLRADGGPAQANKPYIVGEEGPELFVPKGTGTVLPNGVGMGGTTNNTYITNNIQAVDAKSVAQLFATNRKALLGSVEMARKELPY